MIPQRTVLHLGLIATLLALPTMAVAKGKSPFAQFHGTLSERYTLRTTGDQSDNDLENLLSLTVGDVNNDKITFQAQGGVLCDLDGLGANNSIYRTSHDRFGRQLVGRLYYAYLDVQHAELFELVRFGRQHKYDFENFYFDGFSFDTNPFYGIRLGAYTGQPVHLFENQMGWGADDFLVGDWVSWTPIKQIRLKFDHAFLHDDQAAFRATAGELQDHLLGGSAWIDLTPKLETHARFTSFKDQTRDLTLAANYKHLEHNFKLNLKVFRLLERYDIRVPDLDTYSILGTYERFTEYSINATKGLGKHFMADSGLSWRKLDDPQGVSAFNHGFKRVYVALNSSDLIHQGLSLAASGNYYRGEDSMLRDNYFGGSLSAAQKLLNKKLTLSAGTDYYLYHFNYATGNESQDVQTFFARAEFKATKTMRLKSSYGFENSNDAYHTLKLALTKDF